MFGNPVPGRIQAKSEPWAGTPTFRVTSTFADHVASGRGTGIDFGNGRCGDPVLAVAGGTVTQVFTDAGNGALIVRVRHDSVYTTGYAHLSSAVVKVGQLVSRGQTLGYVGKTGATACHLHWGVNKSGTEVDGWPLLDQNGAQADMIAGTWVSHISNRKTTALAGARFRKAPTLDAANIVKTMAGGELIYPIASVNGQAANGSTLWFVCILDGPDAGDAPDTVGYVHSTAVVMPLAVVEAAGGHTDAELAAAVDAAEKAAADAVANSAVQKAATY